MYVLRHEKSGRFVKRTLHQREYASELLHAWQFPTKADATRERLPSEVVVPLADVVLAGEQLVEDVEDSPTLERSTPTTEIEL